MSGAPSIRGCDACRRQKKKCDQLQPACARCQRLRIPCTGRDTIQYRFRNQFVNEPAKSTKRSTKQLSARSAYPRERVRQQQIQHRPLLPLIKSPTNETTYSVSGFVSILEITDPRYDVLSMSHWLGDLPRRFGSNRALDAAMQGVVASFPCLYSKAVTARAMSAYEEALKYVRLSLQDARSNADTGCMCALFLLHVMHEWIGKRHDADGIFELGISYALKSAKRGRALGEFERAVRRAVSICIILESFHRGDVDLESLIGTLVITEGPRPYTRADGKSYESLSLASLVQLPTLFRKPSRHLEHIKQDYKVLQIEVPLLRRQLIELCDHSALQTAAGQVPPPALNRLISSVRAGYALALSIQINFGAAIQHYEPDRDIRAELDELCGQALELAVLVEGCRPIGSGVARLPMVAAWQVTADPAQKTLLEGAMEILRSDAPESPDWMSFMPNIIPVHEERAVRDQQRLTGSCQL